MQLGAVRSAAEPEARPSVLLITLDTTRADRLGAYGYERPTSPHLDALASEAVVHTRAYSTTTWTLPSHASLFTGLFPISHGADYDSEGPLSLGGAIHGPDFLADYRVRGLGETPATLAEILGEAGYATGAVVGGPWLKRVFGLHRGFEHYDDAQISRTNGRTARQITDAAISWLNETSAPFLLFLNYYDPHGPYADPEGLVRRFLPEDAIVYPPPRPPTPEFTAASYDAEILYMDRHIGRLIAHLRETDRYDDLWIVVTADHGELFGEHDRMGHGFSLFERELQIPLIVRSPGGANPGRDERPIQLVDLMPRLLDELSLEAPEGLQGRPGGRGDEPVYAEVYPLQKARDPWRAYVKGRHKLLWHGGGEHQLYDLVSDPEEQTDLAAHQPDRVQALIDAMEADLARWPKRAAIAEENPTDSVREVDPETRGALESLGYLE